MNAGQLTGRSAGKNVGEGPLVVGGKFLTFFLAGEEYGLEILKVHEIIGMMPITPVPRTPDFVCGVINLRGKVIPIMDLRLKLGMQRVDVTEQTCIIVVISRGIEMGVIVDRVSEVLDIANSDVDPAPSFGAHVRSDFILGIGKTNGNVRILLDVDRVMTATEVVEMSEASEQSSEELLAA